MIEPQQIRDARLVLPPLVNLCERSGGTFACAARWIRNGFAKPVLARAAAVESDCGRQLRLALGLMQVPAPRPVSRRQWWGGAVMAAVRSDRALVERCLGSIGELRWRYERALARDLPAEVDELLESHYLDITDLEERLAQIH